MSSLSITSKTPIKDLSIHFWGHSSIPLNESREKEEKAFQEGQSSAEKSFNEAKDTLFKNIHSQFDELVHNVNERIPSLVLSITRKVLGDIEPLEENITKIVNEAIEDAPQESRTLTISLCSHDHELIKSNLDQLNAGDAIIKLKTNDSLKKGDCLIETDFGIIDAKISTKLKKIEESLKGQ